MQGLAAAAAQPLPNEHVDGLAKRLARFMKSHERVDGTDQLAIRDWLDRASMAPEFIPDLNFDAAKEVWASQAHGTVIQALRGYAPQNPTIPGLVAHIRQHCLAPQEGDRAIKEVEQYSQGPVATALEYVAQFHTRVNRAYTVEDLQNMKIERQLMKAFVNGLYNESVRLATANANPQNMEQAFQAPINVEALHEWVRKDIKMEMRHEEPMEIDAVRNTADQNAVEGGNSTLTSILNQLIDKIDRLQRGERGRSTICFYCRKEGHIQRQRRRKQRDDAKKKQVKVSSVMKPGVK